MSWKAGGFSKCWQLWWSNFLWQSGRQTTEALAWKKEVKKKKIVKVCGLFLAAFDKILQQKQALSQILASFQVETEENSLKFWWFMVGKAHCFCTVEDKKV